MGTTVTTARALLYQILFMLLVRHDPEVPVIVEAPRSQSVVLDQQAVFFCKAIYNGDGYMHIGWKVNDTSYGSLAVEIRNDTTVLYDCNLIRLIIPGIHAYNGTKVQCEVKRIRSILNGPRVLSDPVYLTVIDPGDPYNSNVCPNNTAQCPHCTCKDKSEPTQPTKTSDGSGSCSDSSLIVHTGIITLVVSLLTVL